VSSTASPEATRFVAARAEDVPDGSSLVVDVGGHAIAIFNRGGSFYALLNRCPHMGGPLCAGDVVPLVHASVPDDIRLDENRALVVCPWHGWEFDLETGQSYWDPVRTRARRVPVEVEHGTVIAEATRAAGGSVPGPYVAETFPVEVDEDYLVVTVRARPPAQRAIEGGGQ
jgi:nitrite reductase/ring-hydroxylating ferredoxin subunit